MNPFDVTQIASQVEIMFMSFYFMLRCYYYCYFYYIELVNDTRSMYVLSKLRILVEDSFYDTDNRSKTSIPLAPWSSFH